MNEGLLSQQEYDGLSGSAFERFARLPISPPEIFNEWDWSWVTPGRTPVQLSHILGVAFAIAEQKGVRHLGSGSVLAPVLYGNIVASATSRETEELLTKAICLNGLSGYWIGALLRLCYETPSLDLLPLLTFWRRYESDVLPFSYFWLGLDILTDKGNELLQRLLSCGEDIAFRIAMRLIVGGPPDVRLHETLAERLMAALRSLPEGHRDASLCLHALLQLRPRVDEFVIWQDPKNARLLLESGYWKFRRLLERIESAANPKLELNRRQLGECLAPFIIRRRDYPPEVARAALQAMLQLQEGDMRTMQDDDWRQDR